MLKVQLEATAGSESRTLLKPITLAPRPTGPAALPPNRKGRYPGNVREVSGHEGPAERERDRHRGV